MSKHITDQERQVSDAARVRAYLAIERADLPNSASFRLQQKAGRHPESGRRLVEFLRIAKGRLA
jgi:hypothetical protein